MANTIVVGLSGGVDSATSAALLKEEGFQVVGAFIKIWQPEFIECTWAKDRLDAMRVATVLGIPFREVDLSQEYKKEVIGRMIASYESGETPNPDVVCNRTIKFGAFAKWARENGADAIATGHYARVRKTFGSAELLRGVDPDKDQSYFLHSLDRRDLMRAVFPVGELTKTQVRAKARRFGLPVSEKHDSQGLCFVGDVTMRDFLKRYISVSDGLVLDTKGRVIGEHEGAALYTIGQRHGFTVEGTVPQYVTAIDIKKNTIRVSPERALAGKRKVFVAPVHWIGDAPAMPARLFAQSRYREAPVPVTLSREENASVVTFDAPHIASPGQSIVFYDGDICLGGTVVLKDRPEKAPAVHSAPKSAAKALQ